MTKGYECKSFGIGLPVDADDQSLTALFRHVSDVLAEDDPISMDDIIAVSFETELGEDAVYRGVFTVVFDDRDSDTPIPAPSS
jgi:hypothetical protein